MIQRTDPDPDGAGSLPAPITTYNYGSGGLLASLVDASSNTTSWTYDALGRVLSETNELADTKSYEYNAASQLTKVTDRNGRITELNYDNLGRLTSEVWKSGGSTVRTLSYGYDGLSRLTSASDPDATYGYTFDAIGQLTQEDIDFGSGINEFRMQSEYDAFGNRTELALSVDSGSGYVGDLVNLYGYDGMSRMTSIVQKGVSGGATVNDKRVNIQYTSDSRFAEITRYNSETASSGNLVAESFYTYDDLGRLITLDHEDGSSAIATYDFTYDAFSRIEEIVATASTGLAGTSLFTQGDCTAIYRLKTTFSM
jgi:YD repeat-containing protein